MDPKKAKRCCFNADAKFAVKDRFAADGKTKAGMTLVGYAVVWGAMADRWGMKVRFNKGSAVFVEPVMALFHHDYMHPLGRTDNGSLRLSQDETGVKVEIDLPDTTAGRDVAELVRRRDVQGMSFAVVRYVDTSEKTEGGVTIMDVTKFELDEVTVTAIPAFVETSIEVKGKKEKGMPDDMPDEEEMPAEHAAAIAAEQLRLEQAKLDLYSPDSLPE